MLLHCSQVAEFHTLADTYSSMYGMKQWEAPSLPIVALLWEAIGYPRQCLLEAIDEFGVCRYSGPNSHH